MLDYLNALGLIFSMRVGNKRPSFVRLDGIPVHRMLRRPHQVGQAGYRERSCLKNKRLRRWFKGSTSQDVPPNLMTRV